MERGLARAARLAGMDAETQEELVIEAIAEIACSMAQAGQGADLAKLYGAMAYTESGDSDPDSALDRAMRRLPGLEAGTESARGRTKAPAAREKTAAYDAGASDTVSDAPANRLPKRPLLPGQTSMLDGLTGKPIDAQDE